METRDILDYFGAVIGTLEMPDDTTEDQWTAALAPYAQPPPTTIQLYEKKLMQQKERVPIVMHAIRLYMIQNVLSLADASDIYHQLSPELTAANNGAFEIAIYMLQNQTPSGAVTAPLIEACIEALRVNVVVLGS